MSSPRAFLKSILDNQVAAAKLMEVIGERSFKVVLYYVGAQGEYEHTLEEVGTMFLVTRERIRQIVKHAASVAEAVELQAQLV